MGALQHRAAEPPRNPRHWHDRHPAQAGIGAARADAFLSGPLGGDQQVGAKIAENAIDVLIFFWDPLESHPHDPDVRALLRMAVLQNIPVAMNRSSADFIFSSPLMEDTYERQLYDFAGRLERRRAVEALRATGEK